MVLLHAMPIVTNQADLSREVVLDVSREKVLLEQIKGLTSGILDSPLKPLQTDLSKIITLSPEALNERKLANQAYRQWQMKDPSDNPRQLLRRSAYHFKLAAEFSWAAGDTTAHALNCHDHGLRQLDLERWEEAISSLNTAVTFYRDHNWLDLESAALGSSHRAIFNVADSQTDPQQRAIWEAKLAPVRQRLAEIEAASKGYEGDPEAYRGVQGQLLISRG
jgi:hypothetical protein